MCIRDRVRTSPPTTAGRTRRTGPTRTGLVGTGPVGTGPKLGPVMAGPGPVRQGRVGSDPLRERRSRPSPARAARAGDKTNGVGVNLAIGLTGRSGPAR